MPSPCVRSGFCCRQAVCPFGMWDGEREQCIHLQGDHEVAPGVWMMRCDRYEEIVASGKGEFSPAFGAGCCSPMFNQDREAIIRAMMATDSTD